MQSDIQVAGKRGIGDLYALKNIVHQSYGRRNLILKDELPILKRRTDNPAIQAHTEQYIVQGNSSGGGCGQDDDCGGDVGCVLAYKDCRMCRPTQALDRACTAETHKTECRTVIVQKLEDNDRWRLEGRQPATMISLQFFFFNIIILFL